MADTARVRVRFAPSPTGIPHVGNIRSAIFNWLFARHAGGAFILRIEDTDRERYVPESLPAILESLRWLGLDWDEGPEKGGSHGPYVQSERLPVYREHAEKLLTTGQAYYCYCSPERLSRMRQKQREAGQDPKYDRHCLGLDDSEINKLADQGVKPVLRFKIPDQGRTGWQDVVRGEVFFENKQLDDLVLMKSDGYPTYNFANIIDDHLMEISHVIRGEEFVSSTPRHLLLYQAFGYQPPRFVHVPLILGPDRSKLGKRHGATSVFEYRDQGYLPEALLNFLSLLGWSPDNDQEYLTRPELVERFTLEGITKSASIFDKSKLDWLNKKYISAAEPGELLERCRPYLVNAGLLTEGTDRALLLEIMELLRERLGTLTEVVEMSRYFFSDDFEYEEKGVKKYFTQAETGAHLAALNGLLDRLEDFSSLAIEQAVRKLAAERSLSASQIIHPTRLAVSGRLSGPGLFELMAVVGKQRVVQRINRAVERIKNV